MDPTLQRHAAKCIYIIPDGLKELMSDISREVLRMQPQNLYTFIADYLEALLLTRENARVAARLIQSVTEIAETTMDFLQKTGMHKSQVEKVVGIMDRQFKRRVFDERLEQGEHVDEANMISDILNDAELDQDALQESIAIIQKAYRKFKRRKEAEKLLLTGMIDWRIAARSAIKLYRQTGVTNEEAKRAATLIKAAYKGYYTRRIMMTLTEEQKILNQELIPYEVSEPEQEDLSREPSLTKGESKTVTIDYDTVIPHVDFGDVTDLESPSAIATSILDKVLNTVVSTAPKPKSKRASQASERSKKSERSQKSKRLSQKSERLTEVISERKSTVSERRSRTSGRVSYVDYDTKSDISYVSGRSSRVSERSVGISQASARSSYASHVSHVSHGTGISRGSFSSHVSDHYSHVSERGSHVSERGGHLSERGSVVSESGGHVSERGSVVSERGGHVPERGSVVSERDGHVSKRVSVVSERGGHVSERGSVVSERGSVVSERGGHVSERGSVVSERGGHVSLRGSHVSERIDHVPGRGSKISRQSEKELPKDLLI